MAFDRYLLDDIRNQVPLESIVSQFVTLRSASGKLKGLCPFHAEKTPSFTVDPVKKMFYCFGCQTGGDVFAFLMLSKNCSFHDAVKECAEMVGIEIQEESPSAIQNRKKKQSLYDVLDLAMEKFTRDLRILKQAEPAREYLLGRGFSDDTMNDFSLGYATDSFDELIFFLQANDITTNLIVQAGLAKWRDPADPTKGAFSLFRDRIMIPIFDYRGKVVAFGGRVLPNANSDAPKYINSPETDVYKKSQTLYGLSQARNSISRNQRCILVEGYFDVISLHQNGFKETIASCGTALTQEHVRIIRPLSKKVYTLFDMDEAGIRAARRSLPSFMHVGVEVLRIHLPNSKDPDEFLQKYGSKEFEECLEQAEPLIQLEIRELIQEYGQTASGKQQVIEKILPLIKKLPVIEKEQSIHYLSRELHVHEESIRSQIRNRNVQKELPQQKTYMEPHIQDLLWLLMNFPHEVRPRLENIEPHKISMDEEIIYVMGHLMQGEEIVDVISDVSNEDIKRTLVELSMRMNYFPSDKVVSATEQILITLELRYLDTEIIHIQNRIRDLTNNNETLKILDEIKLLEECSKQQSILKKKLHEV